MPSVGVSVIAAGVGVSVPRAVGSVATPGALTVPGTAATGRAGSDVGRLATTSGAPTERGRTGRSTVRAAESFGSGEAVTASGVAPTAAGALAAAAAAGVPAADCGAAAFGEPAFGEPALAAADFDPPGTGATGAATAGLGAPPSAPAATG
ncbi:hypothetical protein ACGF0D_30505 [Kitasatospora sp. NPDC048298]|uniref:hypothetical protein n=1 Tax=Kitasatospora sp. NPDC048298 TaxID=3364049 RepID=UPI003720FD72